MHICHGYVPIASVERLVATVTRVFFSAAKIIKLLHGMVRYNLLLITAIGDHLLVTDT